MPLYVPRRSTEGGFVCRICKALYGPDEMHQFERHVESCFIHNEQEVLERAHTRQAPGLFEVPDPEWQAYNEDLTDRGINPDEQFKRRPGKTAKRSLRES